MRLLCFGILCCLFILVNGQIDDDYYDDVPSPRYGVLNSNETPTSTEDVNVAKLAQQINTSAGDLHTKFEFRNRINILCGISAYIYSTYYRQYK